MKSKGLIIATVVLAALSGALYWSNHHPPADDTAKASLDTPPKILTLKQEEISRLAILKNGNEAVALAKNDSGKWQITTPKPLAADQDAVSGVLGTVASLNSDRLVDEKAGDLRQYGLARPALEVDVTEKDNKSQKLLIGDDTPTGSAVFAKLEGDPRVFTIASYNKNSVDKSANDLRDKHLLTTDFDKVSQLELIAKNQTIEFGRNKQEWQILKPRPLRADNSQVEDLVRSLREAKLEVAANDEGVKKAAAGFAAGAPVATVKATDTSGTQELQVRKNKDAYFAKSSAVVGVYKVGNEVSSALNKSLEDFRNKKLFDFGYDDPTKIEMHDGAKAYFLTKGGQDWWGADGKKLDAMSVQTLIDKLRALAAKKFVDSGVTTQALDIRVSSDDGKRTEHVLISKNGDKWIARRENEPSLYELDDSVVTDLQKSAADVKPEPPPQPAAAPAKKKK